ncbi:MAG: type II toxin-antitoxin system death-on-curing family toxin [Actinomycetes bacterium]
MSPATIYLDLADVLSLATRLLGDPPPIRDVGLLESAVARPRTVVFGVHAYESIWTKAAALLQSIVNNHALIDGNKRLGWLATAVFLELNDIPISHASNESVYELVLAVASGSPEVDEIAEHLQSLINP